MSPFPNHVDTIIIGTGLANSILAAACSRIGKSVLHLDENSYYGNFEASFTFQQLIEWITATNPHDPSLKGIPEELMNKSRMFCIDLAPRFLFSVGDMVDLLVKSNVARYHEFKNNIRILCLVGHNEIHVMPCRRNEVFTSPLLKNLADKRLLMKFIETCVKFQDEESLQSTSAEVNITDDFDKPIGQYLDERGLKPMLKEYIINSIAMVHPTETTREACKRIKKFMMATERYGRSPFLFPLYGCGEFPQSFCRLSAVFGGIYCLGKRINDVDSSGSKFTVRFGEENHVVTSDSLVVDRQDVIKLKLDSNVNDHGENLLSRAIVITNKSIAFQEENDSDEASIKSNDLISFLRIPQVDEGKEEIFLIELNSSALVCPKEYNIIYLWTKSKRFPSSNAEADLKPMVDRLFRTINSESDADRGDCVIWEFYFLQTLDTSIDSNVSQREGLFITSPSHDDIDYAGIVSEAERTFTKICPGQEFLPRAPDPDEIVHSD